MPQHQLQADPQNPSHAEPELTALHYKSLYGVAVRLVNGCAAMRQAQDKDVITVSDLAAGARAGLQAPTLRQDKVG